MPLDKHIEGGHGERESGLEIRPAPMHDLLEVHDEREHREDRLYQQAVLPLTTLTQFEIAWIACCGMEAGITQDYHLFFKLSHQLLKGFIRDIGGRTLPRDHQPPLVEQQTAFPADNPAMIGEAFAADLLGAAPLPYGVDQFDPLGVDHPEHGRSGQEGLHPVLMGLEKAEEPGALGEAGRQRPRVARQPAMERPVAHAFEGMQ
jgi:hypothetical protein